MKCQNDIIKFFDFISNIIEHIIFSYDRKYNFPS